MEPLQHVNMTMWGGNGFQWGRTGPPGHFMSMCATLVHLPVVLPQWVRFIAQYITSGGELPLQWSPEGLFGSQSYIDLFAGGSWVVFRHPFTTVVGCFCSEVHSSEVYS